MSDFDTVTVTDVPAEARILDVREDYEWVAGHAEAPCTSPWTSSRHGSSELDPGRGPLRHLPHRRTVLPRRPVAVGQGYSAMNVAGGMDQWLEVRKPLVSDNGLKPVIL